MKKFLLAAVACLAFLSVPEVAHAVPATCPIVLDASGSPMQSTCVLIIDSSGNVAALPISGTIAATQSGTWTVQPGNVANTTAWKTDGSAVIQPVSGAVNLASAATGGCTLSGTQSAATTNSTNIKASAGTWCGGKGINTTATLYYLRLYNSASAPTCSSATNFVATIPIPASASGAGTDLSFGTFGADFSAGISFCLTGGPTSTDNTAAATGVFLAYATK